MGEGACFANGAMLCPSQTEPWNRPGVLSSLLRSFKDPGSAIKVRLHAMPSLMTWGWRFLRNATPERHALATRRIYELAQYSLEVFQPYLERHAAAFDAARCGTMKIFRSQESLDAHIAVNAQLEPLGLSYQVLDRGGLVAVEPQLQPIGEELVGAIRFPADIVADANKFCRVLADDLVQMGAEIHTGCTVEALLGEGEAITGARTRQGEYRAENTVLTLGADPGRVAARAGVRLPIRPVKGYSITYETAMANASPAIPVVDDTLHVGVIPVGSRLRVAGTADFAGYDQRISSERVANLESVLSRLYPDLSPELAVRGGRPWVGFRPMSADGLPFIGPTQRPGLWVNAGHGHLGWTLAAGSAEILADLLLGETPKGRPDVRRPRPLALDRPRPACRPLKMSAGGLAWAVKEPRLPAQWVSLNSHRMKSGG